MDLHFHAPRVLLERVAYLQKARPGFAGVAILQADLSGDLRESQFLPANAEIKGTLQDLRIDTKPVGSANFEAHTASGALAMTLDAELAGSRVHGAGQAQLHGDYLGNANLTFSNLRYSSIQSLLAADAPFEALAEGQANFSGSFLQPREGTGSLQISRLEFSGTRPDLAAVALRNDGRIAARLDHSTIVIQQAKLTGTSTSINLAGSVGLNRGGPLDVRVDANADLSVAKTFNPDAFASGTVTANANVRGTFSDPQVTGRIDLKDASLQLADWPNGISNANGSILLNGTSARVNAISAQTGGGKLTIDGIAGFTGAAFDFNLRASAEQVRTRYAGASVTANASLTLTGNSQRSSLNGSATITRVGYSQQSDLGAILTQATAPPSAPAVPGLASRVRLNMRVRTAPGARFQTDLAEQLSATVDLNVLGTLQNPGMAGRITVNSGTLIFFGNKYTVNRGTILFFSATAIQPVLDIDLETSAQGVDINLSVSGPIDNLKLSYRSDPPLKFDDIVALLATGRTPPDPTIAVNQPYSPDLSATQMGESAILGQAIANPIANRLQRVFGVTQLKISPTFVAGSALPQARISLQEQVSAAVTLTYSQDLNQANSQLIRIELELTPRFSAVATRDENGIFGVDFYYKKQFR